MDNDSCDNRLPDELRGIADGLREAREMPDGHVLDRVLRRVHAGAPARSFGARLRPRLIASVVLSAAVAIFLSGALRNLPGGLGGGLGGFSLASVVTSSTSASEPSAANDVYCQDGSSTSCTCTNPPKGFPNLTHFWSQYSVFALNGISGKSQTANFDSGTFYGPIGIASGATMVVQHADSFLTFAGGTPDVVDLAHGAAYNAQGTPSNPPTVLQSSAIDSQLASDRSSLISLSGQLGGLTPTVTYSHGIQNATGQTVTITGTAGLNVIDINGPLTLNAPLVLTGPANAFFVLNVAGDITFDGNGTSNSAGAVQVAGLVAPSNVIVNMTGHYTITSQRYGTGITGTLLAPTGSGGSELSGTFGALYVGGSFMFQSYPTVKGVQCGS